MPRTFEHVIVLVPGILGSVLAKGGKEKWGPSSGSIFRALVTLGGSVKALKLEGDDSDLADLGDGVTAPRILPDAHLIPGVWKVDGYSGISKFLVRRFRLEPGKNFFEFPYDWRRDNRAAAKRLERDSQKWLSAWRRESGNEKARLVLVAHSMGGLVSRYFLEVLEGWKDTRALITFGTPYRGSLNALDFLVNGLRKSLGPVPVLDLSELLKSFPSVYQLLPTFECVDEGDGEIKKVSDAAKLPELNWDMVKNAAAFHQEIRDAVLSHRDRDEYLDRGYQVCPIVGVYQDTYQSALLEPDGLRMLRELKGAGEDLSGDGTVPRVSAVPREHGQLSGRSATARHAALQNDENVRNQVHLAISGIRIDDVLMRSVTDEAGVGLTLDDSYLCNEPFTVRVRCTDASRTLWLGVEVAQTKTVVETREVVLADDGRAEVELGPLEADLYRMRVTGDGVQTVEDVFVTLEP